MVTGRRRDGRWTSTRRRAAGRGGLASIGAAVALVATVACATGPRGDGPGTGADAPAPEAAPASERWVLLDVRDAATGRPVGACAVVGWRGTRRHETMVTPSGMHRADDGRHRFVVPADVTSVLVAADGYAEAWVGVPRSATTATVALRSP